jgi:basic membrane lipoprotein Med (substrate-binding protein (PBP1-ABC) superfamily)/tRNA A-37 threonylcarbamoyl transferase component Bud32
MEDLTGKQMGQFQIIEPLGEGGMAAVYKAYQPSMDRYVAIKVLPRQYAEDPKFLARFDREAKLIAKLQHPHILQVFDYGQEDGYTYLVMPFVETGTLTDLLHEKRPTLEQIRHIGSQVGDALAYAHGRGLVHRDIKPSNVLIDDSGNCLLADFGIARMVETTDKITQTGAVVGTPSYMSPEQGSGSSTIDLRSDIYSLGIILYEMAVGRVPFRAETPVAVIFKHVNDPLPPPRSINPAIPEALELVILKALAKRPEDRFASADEMVKMLRAALPEGVEWKIMVASDEKTIDALISEQEDQQTGSDEPKQEQVRRERKKTGKPSRKAFVGIGIAVSTLVILGAVCFVTMFATNYCLPEGPWPVLPWCQGVNEAEEATGENENTQSEEEHSGSGEESDEGEGEESAAIDQGDSDVEESVLPEKDVLVCLMTTENGVDDRYYAQMAWRGILAASEDFGIQAQYLEPASSFEFESVINTFIEEDCDLIVITSFFAQEETFAAAGAHPEKNFLIIDGLGPDPILPNLVGTVFNVDQPAFLAGYVAASRTKSEIVYTYGGMDIPGVVMFMDGFWYGVQYYNEVHGTQVEVRGWNPVSREGVFTDDFFSRQIGIEMGEVFLAEGADVIFPVAGFLSRGTADAIYEHGNSWYIGVDVDANMVMPEYDDIILTSVLKEIDHAVYEHIKLLINGEFRGGTWIGTLDNGGVGIVWDETFSDELNAELEEVVKGLISRDIQIGR